MVRFARWCFLHRKAVLAGWLLALFGFIAVGQLRNWNLVDFDDEYNLDTAGRPYTDIRRVWNKVSEAFDQIFNV